MITRTCIFLVILVLTSCNDNPTPQPLAQFTQWSQTENNLYAIQDLDKFLKSKNVDGILPMDELLRSDVRWKKCKSEPFNIPPKNEWTNIVSTLRVVRDQIVPLVGPVEGLSVYREPKINNCIGGASNSFHMRFFAIDMHPKRTIERAEIIERLCAWHKDKGKKLNIGLGIYSATRFHIDTAGYRKWGQDKRAASSPCSH